MKSFTLDRTIDVPRETVFGAFLDPDSLPVWWGPPGFDIPRDSVVLEPVVGGRYELDMIDPSGKAFPVRQSIAELVEPDLLVLVHIAMPEMGLPEEVTTRIELSGATRLVIAGGPYPDEMAPMAEQGFAGQLTKLEALLG